MNDKLAFQLRNASCDCGASCGLLYDEEAHEFVCGTCLMQQRNLAVRNLQELQTMRHQIADVLDEFVAQHRFTFPVAFDPAWHGRRTAKARRAYNEARSSREAEIFRIEETLALRMVKPKSKPKRKLLKRGTP